MRVININEFNKQLLNELNVRSNGTILFYHPQCGHCQALKPEWERMKSILKESKQNCNIYEVNGDQMQHIQHPIRNMVDGFPTILNVNKGKITTFEKQRDAQDMAHFVMSNLPSPDQDVSKSKKYMKKRSVGFAFNEHNNLVKSRKVLNAKNVQNSIKLAHHKIKTNKKQNKRRKTQKNKKTQNKRKRVIGKNKKN
jgi:thioredoxin-like negative regulator of GroEL